VKPVEPRRGQGHTQEMVRVLVSRDHDSGLVAFSVAETGAVLPEEVRVLQGPVAVLVEDMLDEAVERAARTGDELRVDLDELVNRAETWARRRWRP
jgi:hypothetical protein